MSKLLVKRLTTLPVSSPSVAHPGEDLGYDVCSAEYVRLMPGVVTKVKTGFAMAFVDSPAYNFWRRLTFRKPRRFGLVVGDRSGLASKGIIHSAGIIDAGYTGEISILLTWFPTPNAEYAYFEILPGERIAQLIPTLVLTSSVERVGELPSSNRGEKGWGSSGK
jgi:dUTP pyrophosphatase